MKGAYWASAPESQNNAKNFYDTAKPLFIV